MNRLIKHRAWDGEKFLPWNELKWYPLRALVNEDKCCDFVFQRFTGLLDKNEVEIYEGDIVKYQWERHDSEREETTGEVFFSRGIFFFDRDMEFCSTDANFLLESIEVIGNIFQNPIIDEND